MSTLVKMLCAIYNSINFVRPPSSLLSYIVRNLSLNSSRLVPMEYATTRLIKEVRCTYPINKYDKTYNNYISTIRYRPQATVHGRM